MRGKRVLQVLVAVAVAVCFAAAPVFAQPKPIKWKAQCWVGTSDLAYKTFQNFCAKVKVLTGGRLEITALPAGAVVPPAEMLDAVKSGVLQAMNAASIYYAGKEPAFAFLGDMSGAWEAPWEVDAYMHYFGGLELLREAYKPFGVYPVGVMWVGAESMPCNKPVTKIEDFKGLKWRMPQGIPSEWMKRMGGTPVVVPGDEVYSSLEKGIIDGTDWGTPSMNRRMGFHQVCKYFTWPGWHSMATMDFSVNTEEWNKLPEDIKAILTEAVRAWAWDMVETLAVDDVKALQDMKAAGAQPAIWTPQEIARARVVARGVWEDYAKKSPLAQKCYDSIKVWLKQLGRMD